MPLVTLYRLRPRGPMHAGTRGIEVEGALPFPSAATFFSAWCWAIRDLTGAGRLERLLDAFRASEPPFLLAAPLPWIGPVLLLPRPWLPASNATGDGPRDKRGKRYRWVEESLWLRLVDGGAPQAAFEDDAAFHQEMTIWAAGEAGASLIERQAALAAEAAPDLSEPPAFWRVAILPHVTVDRRSNAGNIYRRGATWFASGVDLALPVAWRDESDRDLMEQALTLLGDEGVGGERSAGYGQFDLAAPETRVWPDAADTPTFVTLAGYHPTQAEVAAGIFAPPASYELEMSRGWVERSTLPHRVRLVTAGSVLRRIDEQDVYGELVDVTPARFREHRVYRYGFAFPLPVRLSDEATAEPREDQ